MRTRDTIIFSKPKPLRYVLDIVGKHINSGYMQLLKYSEKVRGGSFSHTLKDLQNMGLIANGNGLHPTELGKQLLLSLVSSEEEKVIMKQAALNVPLFHQCFAELPDIKEYAQIKEWLLRHTDTRRFEERLIGPATRRYIEYVYGQEVEPRPIKNTKQHGIDYFFPAPQTNTGSNVGRSNAGGGGAGGGTGGREVYLFEALKEDGYSEEELAAAEAALTSALQKDKAWKLLHMRIKK